MTDQRASDGAGKAKLQHLPAQLQLHCFSFLDGAGLTIALAAVKWELSEEKTDRLFQTAFVNRCGEDAALMLVAKSGSHRWKRAFVAALSADQRWRKGALTIVSRRWTQQHIDIQLTSTRVFEPHTVERRQTQLSWRLEPGGWLARHGLPGNARPAMLRGEEALIEWCSASQLNVLDVDGKQLSTVALNVTLASPTAVAFGRFFGYCNADQSIHIHSLDSAELECKIDMTQAIKLGGNVYQLLPVSTSCFLLKVGPHYALRRLLATLSSTRELRLPAGYHFAPDLCVSRGVCCIQDGGGVWLLRESAIEQGFRKIADLGELSCTGWESACVREPTRDLIIIVWLSGTIVALDLDGRIVRRVDNIAFGEVQNDVILSTTIRTVVAWRNRVAVVTEISNGRSFLTICDFS